MTTSLNISESTQEVKKLTPSHIYFFIQKTYIGDRICVSRRILE